MTKVGLVLYAHGARDPKWAEPFERVLCRVRERAPGVDSRLAYLEQMAPDLPTAVAELVASGANAIRVVPLFFGQGGHVRRDLPDIIAKLKTDNPAIAISCAGPAGEDEKVVDALAWYCLDGLES